MGIWRSGSALATFPIPHGTAMGGYADREWGSAGVLDELEIGALVLENSGRRLHILTADVVGVDFDLVNEVAATAGVAREDLLLCASHTHSGPSGVLNRLHPAGPDDLDPDLRARFTEELVGVLKQAIESLEPVTLFSSSATVDGAWTNRIDPDIPTDNRVRSLQVRRLDGTLQTLLMLVPCHPTVLGAWNREVSADLHGGIRRAVRALLPPSDATARILTCNGAAGDISSRFTRRESSFAEVKRLGGVVAEAMASALGQSVSIGDGLRAVSIRTTLPTRDIDRATADGQAHDAESALKAIEQDASATEAARRQAYTRLQGARILQAMPGLLPPTVEITAWQLGEDFRIVTVPGELFSSLGTAMESVSGSGTTWVIGYANGYIGYLPDEDAFARETYEALASPFPANIGQIVIDIASDLLERLRA